jgi:hypothetical protein
MLADSAREAMLGCIAGNHDATRAIAAMEHRTREIERRLAVLQAAIDQIGGVAEALSVETSDATREIHECVKTLKEESHAIAAAVGDSLKTVIAGGAAVRQVGGGIQAAVIEVAGVAKRVRGVSDLLSHQCAATAEIAKRAQQISGKAAKTKYQVAAIAHRLESCETLIEDTFDTAAYWPIEDFGLVRFKADASAWKRRLVSMMLGHAQPQEKPAHLEAAHALFDAGHHGAVNPQGAAHAVAFTDAVDAARKHAETVEVEIRNADWIAATPAYTACEGALKKALAAADNLMKLSAPAKSPLSN